ncbi:MAG TPA: hypothetical protein VHM00_02780 [Caldimonas sp.]|jgi:hypothetical protein|nr:hypothetical protein [Caldimonas sp.]HEX2539987.1 hypothetical protein [Caldimonas sp.]
MKQLHRLILACAAFATCGVATAQTYDAAADQERRARNREEAIAKHNAMQSRSTSSSRVAERSDAGGGPTLGDRARKAGKSVRNFTHRQAEKARNFSDRQDRRWGKRGAPGPNRNRTGGTPD